MVSRTNITHCPSTSTRRDQTVKDRMTSTEYRMMMGLESAPKPHIAIVGSAPQIRMPKHPEPNKTEEAWMEQAKRIHPGCTVRFAPFKLRLPSGCQYTPDVVVTSADGRVVAIYEVKGAHIHNERSIHAFKEAAAAYPEFKFHFTQLVKGVWRTTK